jgi:hypothetical protein
MPYPISPNKSSPDVCLLINNYKKMSLIKMIFSTLILIFPGILADSSLWMHLKSKFVVNSLLLELNRSPAGWAEADTRKGLEMQQQLMSLETATLPMLFVKTF